MQYRIAEAIGGEEGWVIVLAATDPISADHLKAVSKVNEVAAEIGVEWRPPA